VANLTITAAEVLQSSTGRVSPGVCGETLAAGDVVYKDSGDSNKLKLGDSNHSTTAKSVIVGIMVNGGAAGQPADYCSKDSGFTIGTTAAPVAGEVYCLSTTAGKLCPLSDFGTANTARVSIIGVGKAAGGLNLSILNSGVVKTS
jgi:hypothetical protein